MISGKTFLQSAPADRTGLMVFEAATFVFLKRMGTRKGNETISLLDLPVTSRDHDRKGFVSVINHVMEPVLKIGNCAMAPKAN